MSLGSTYVAVTDPQHLVGPDGRFIPHRTWLEILGGKVHGLSAFHVRLGERGARELGEAVSRSPKAGTFGRLTWGTA